MLFTMVVESFFIESNEGIFFDVKGVYQPEEWIIAYARYFPEECLEKTFLHQGQSRRSRLNGNNFYKFYNVNLRQEIMNSCFPGYVFPDPRCHSVKLQGLPRSAIKKIYDPMDYRPDDEISIAFLNEIDNITGFKIGITGSRLVGLNDQYSDIDAVMIGTHEECQRFYQELEINLTKSSIIRPYTSEEVYQLYKTREQKVPSDSTVYKELEKPNQGIIELSGKKIDFYVRIVETSRNRLHDCHYDLQGAIKFKGTIKEGSRGILTPSIYEVVIDDGSHLHKKIGNKNIYISSYRGRHAFKLLNGQEISGHGVLEKMKVTLDNKIKYRVIIGGLTTGSLEINP